MLAPAATPIANDWPSASTPDAGPSSRWRASVDLAYQARGGRTIPTLRRHCGPLRVLKGYRQSGEDCWEQVLVHPPGGIAGNDQLDIQVRASHGAQVLITTPGAGKWYRSGPPLPSEPAQAHPGARQTVSVSVTGQSGFEWLPLENIFYDGAAAMLDTHFDVAPEAALIAADVYCLGRPASSAPFERGQVQMQTRVSRDGRPLFIERARLLGGSRALSAPAGLNGQPCFGSLIAVPAHTASHNGDHHLNPALAALANLAREALRDASFSGELAVTALPHLVVVRWRGASAEAGWLALRAAWQVLRKPVLGRAAQEPRIWAC